MSPRPFLRLLPLAAIALAAACSETFDASANCPVLCADQSLVVRDTTFDIVQYDSAFAGFTGIGERWPAPGLPTLGSSGYLYETFLTVADRGDSLDVRQVFRFDTLARTLSASDTTPIRAVSESKLLLVIDTARSVFPSGEIAVDLYDVDDASVTNDTSTAQLVPLFREDRRIATRTFSRTEIAADTISGFGAASTVRAFSIAIPDSVLLNRIRGSGRLRVGLRVRGAGSAALRFMSPSVNSEGLIPRLTYDPAPQDTAIDAYLLNTQYKGTLDLPALRRFQSLVLKDRTTLLNDGSLEVGGLTGVRSLMKVVIPRTFLDTVTIVRATFDLTQRPKRGEPGARDGIRVRLRLGIAGPALGADPRRLVEVLDPLIEGVQLSSLRIAPGDSGVRAFDVASALRLWSGQDSTVPTNFVLYSEGETFQEQRPAFFSSRHPNPAVRPRLRITYTTRREGAIP